MIQSGGFIDRLFSPLLKAGLPITKNVIKLLVKSVLVPLGSTAAASAAEPRIHKKNLRICCPSSSAARTTALIISNDEIKDTIKIIKFLEDSGLLLKRVSETVQNEAKE